MPRSDSFRQTINTQIYDALVTLDGQEVVELNDL